MQVVFFLLDCGYQTYFMGQGTLWLKKKKIKKAKIKKKSNGYFLHGLLPT